MPSYATWGLGTHNMVILLAKGCNNLPLLAKHVLKDKKKAPDGSPKSSPKVSRGRQTASSVASSSLRSTAPAGPISSSSGRGKEKLSSTTTAVSNGHSGNREGRGDRERRGRPAGREEVREKLSASHSKSSEKKSSSDRVPATRDQRERAGQGKEGIRDKRSSERAVRREDDGRGGREHGSRSRKEGERREQHEISRRVREGTPPPPSAPLVGAQSGPRGTRTPPPPSPPLGLL